MADEGDGWKGETNLSHVLPEMGDGSSAVEGPSNGELESSSLCAELGPGEWGEESLLVVEMATEGVEAEDEDVNDSTLFMIGNFLAFSTIRLMSSSS